MFCWRERGRERVRKWERREGVRVGRRENQGAERRVRRTPSFEIPYMCIISAGVEVR